MATTDFDAVSGSLNNNLSETILFEPDSNSD